jgi:predicted acetyltransferase
MVRHTNSAAFHWLEPGELIDGDLRLQLKECRPPDPDKGRVPCYVFSLITSSRPEPVGEIHFRVGTNDKLQRFAGHMGYTVAEAARGHHFASRAIRLLLPLAKSHGLTELWITCNPDNAASRRTCELAGAVFVEMADLSPETNMYAHGERRKCRYRIDLRSPAS